MRSAVPSGPEVDSLPPVRLSEAASPLSSIGLHRAAAEMNTNTRGGDERWRASPARAQGSQERRGEAIEVGMWRLGLQIGSKLDVKDTINKWCEASVLVVDRETGKVLVTYTFWSSKWDQWLGIDDPRLQLPGTRTYQQGGPLRIGHRVEVMDDKGNWLEADVVEESADGSARVKFKRLNKSHNAWVSPYGGNVRQFGPYRAGPKGKRSARQASLAPGQQHVRQIAQLSSRYEQYSRALDSKGLRVVPVEGDGNCLFRSVSHQIYGDDSHHRLVRARCMDYMEIEAPFFESYVEGDMAAFLRYLEVKRHNAVWGDDPEVQALSEIYNRPAEIWAYDPQLGARTLRTFHESGTSTTGELAHRRTPMRLSYYGGGHYDSVSPVVGEHGAGAVGVTFEPILEPGRLEEDALERSRRRVRDAGGGSSDRNEMKMRKEDEESASEDATMDHALAWSRNVFEAQCDDLDSALVASVDHMEQSNLSSLEAASRDSELVILQEEMLRTAQVQSEEEQLRKALEASSNTAAAAAAEAEMVRQAIAESMTATAAAGGGGVGTEGTAANEAGAGATATLLSGGLGQDADGGVPEEVDDEDEELKRALLLSGMGVEWETPSAGAQVGQGFDLDELHEDAELRLAIKASLAGE